MAIQGMEDQYGTEKQIESIAGRVKTVETHLIKDCQHSPHADQPGNVMNIMNSFIQKQFPCVKRN